MSFIPCVKLSNFEGPLDLLVQLIQREEISVYAIEIEQMIRNFLESISLSQSFDSGAEFLGGASLLLLLKSKKLIPTIETEKEELESYTAILQDILEYCSFKEVAQKLNGSQENAYRYPRGIAEVKESFRLCPEALSIQDLTIALENILKKAHRAPQKIQGQEYVLSDYIAELKEILKTYSSISFFEYFSLKKPKEVLIVSFLALLQLMKEQKAYVTESHLIKVPDESLFS